jgi:PAS domain-containing protein
MRVTPHRYPPRLVQVIVPILYLGVVLILDHTVPGATIMPALLTVGLLSISFFFDPICISATVVLYTSFVAGGFFMPLLSRYVNPSRSSLAPIEYSHYLRTITFFTVGSFSVLFSIMLRRIRQAQGEVNELVGRFPYPLVISTETGTLSYANKAAEERFGFSCKEASSLDFARLFAPKSSPRDFPYEYAKRFSQHENPEAGGTHSNPALLELEFQGKRIYGDTLPLTTGGRTNLLTIFLETERQG